MLASTQGPLRSLELSLQPRRRRDTLPPSPAPAQEAWRSTNFRLPDRAPLGGAAGRMAEQPDDRSYYALLGVAPTASDEEIRRAFRQLATTLHPDKASLCLCTQSHGLLQCPTCVTAQRLLACLHVHICGLLACLHVHIRGCRCAPLPSRFPMLHSMTRRRPCSPRYRRLTR